MYKTYKILLPGPFVLSLQETETVVPTTTSLDEGIYAIGINLYIIPKYAANWMLARQTRYTCGSTSNPPRRVAPFTALRVKEAY